MTSLNDAIAAITKGRQFRPRRPLAPSGHSISVAQREALKKWCDERDKEAWQGTSSAFRAGVKARFFGGECRYLVNLHFQDAWKRGWAAMDSFLASGGELTYQARAVRPRRK